MTAGVPILRPVREADLPALLRLAGRVTGTLTSLPSDAEALDARVHESLRAFYPKVRRPGGEAYLFVLEVAGDVVGTSGIIARVGGFEPFYTYAVEEEALHFPPLGVDRRARVLQLRKSFSGPTELATLFLEPARRTGGLGRLLSLGRFLFMAAFPQRFDRLALAEMRGYADEGEQSPFWEAVGRTFYGCDFPVADALSGKGSKDFIAALHPRHPLYVDLLPPAAQAALGRVHRETEPALRLLREQGFAPTGEVDIFDAGPLVSAPVAQVATVAARTVGRLAEVGPVEAGGPPVLLANDQIHGFRATLAPAAAVPGGWRLPAEVAEAMHLAPGATFSQAPLRPALPATAP